MSYALIAGGGITGLTAGYRLAAAGWEVEVWEAAPFLGGMAYTFNEGDWLLDLGPHKVYTPNQELLEELFRVLPRENFVTVEKHSQIRLRGQFLRYPVSLGELLRLSPLLCLKCGISYAGATLTGRGKRREEISYQDYLQHRYGKALYELVFAPYARKIWGPPEKLSKQLAESRVVVPSLLTVLRQMLFGQPKDKELSVKEFQYPRKGSGQICQALADGILGRGGKILTGRPLAKTVLENGRMLEASGAGGETRRFAEGDVLISTIPPASLAAGFSPAPPRELIAAAQALRTRHLILLYIEIERPLLTSDNWIFYPEEKYRWNRAFEQKNFSPEMGPTNRTCLCLEITCADDDPLWHSRADQVFEVVMPQLEETGLFKRAEVLRHFDRRIADGYPVYDLAFADNLNYALDHFSRIENLYAVGRQGSFSYGGMLDCFQMGLRTADQVISRGSRESWREIQRSFQIVEVVD
jgi:protoporphyrinogen oxidase